MEKADIKSRVDSIRDNAEKDRKKNHYKSKECPEQEPKKPENSSKKVCPFSLVSGKARVCGSWCQLHRQGKSAFACPLQELSTISWNTRK